MKTKIIPFDIELAKKIQAGEIEGKIVTRDGHSVRSICYDAENEYPLICLVKSGQYEDVHSFHLDGSYGPSTSNWDLFIELPEETSKQKEKLTLGKCKEGDEVWMVSNYEYGPKYIKVKVGKFSLDMSSGRRRNVATENGFSWQALIHQTCWYENPDEQKVKTKEPIKETQADLCEEAWLASKKNHEFKPFDRVLVRDYDNDWWVPTFFGFQTKEGLYRAVNGVWKQCIPYEGNEHLIGTTNNPE